MVIALSAVSVVAPTANADSVPTEVIAVCAGLVTLAAVPAAFPEISPPIVALNVLVPPIVWLPVV